MAEYTFQVFQSSDGAAAPSGVSTMVSPSAQAITITVVDNDTTLHDQYSSFGGLVDPNGAYSQTLLNAVVINGISIPAGSAVTSNNATNITNLSTGQTGLSFELNFMTAGGSYLTVGYGFSIPVSAGDTLSYSTNNLAGQTPYSSFAPLTSGGIPCFTSGTRILTPKGERLIEDLRCGDHVITSDGRAQPVIWHVASRIGADDLAANPDLQPIVVPKGFMGATAAIALSPQHGVMVVGDAGAVLVRARHLAEFVAGTCRRTQTTALRYHHLMLPQHSLLRAEGAWVESFHPGEQALKFLAPSDRRDLESALQANPKAASGRCLRLVTRAQAKQVLQRHSQIGARWGHFGGTLRAKIWAKIWARL